MEQYLQLLKRPGALRLSLSSLPGRLAYGISNLAVFFHVKDLTGSISSAALAVGAYSLFSSATAAPRGHVIDRFGQTRPLMVLVPSYATANLLLAFVAHDRWTAIVYAGLMGLTSPPINMSIRPLWKSVAGDDLIRTAYAFDTVVLESTSVLGPAISTYLAITFGGRTALVATSMSMLVGGILLLTSKPSRDWVPEPKLAGEPGLLRSPAMRVLAVEGLLIGFGFGMLNIAIPGAATLAGVPGAAAWALSAVSVGAILGGVIAGSQFKHWAPGRGLTIVQYVSALLLMPLFLMEPGWQTAVLMLFAGVPSGMAQVFYLELIDLVRPRGTAVTALATIWFIEGSAGAAGNSVAGLILEQHGTLIPMLGCALLVLGSAVVFTVAGRGPLKAAMSLTGAEPDGD